MTTIMRTIPKKAATVTLMGKERGDVRTVAWSGWLLYTVRSDMSCRGR